MISTVFEIGANLIDTILAIYFLTEFNFASWRKNHFYIPAFIAIFAFSLFSNYLLPGFTFLPVLILSVLEAIYAILICRKHYIRAIISVCIYEIALILLSSFLYTIISMIIQNFDLVMQNSSSVSRYLFLILHKVSLFAVLRLFLLLFRPDTMKAKLHGILTFAFTLITVFGLGATMVLTALPNASEIQNQILFIIVAFIAANVLLYFLLYQVQKLQQNKYELKLLQEKMHFEEMRYIELTAIQSNVQKMRHDINQHLTVISGYLQDDNMADCKKYLREVLDEAEKNATPFHSGNSVLDYVIHAKLDSLSHVRTVVMGHTGNFSDIKDTDLACLIGNILDNAIDGVAGVAEKYIELYFHVEKGNRIILCRNTVSHSVLDANPALQSTKPHKEEHGLGHKIIAKIVADYNGMLNYYEENGMFSVQVILPIPHNRVGGGI